MKTAVKENPSVLLLFVAMALLFVFALKPLVDLDLHDKVMFGVAGIHSLVCVGSAIVCSQRRSGIRCTNEA